jgi:hypothetical protein
MKRKYLILFFIYSSYSNAQFNINSGLNKYWNYRYALVGDSIDPHHSPFEAGFVEAGIGQGSSIPMRSRYRQRMNIGDPYPSSWHWNMQNPCCISYPPTRDPGAQPPLLPGPNFWGILKWHDAMKEMGEYLAFLAAEYKLLSLNENRQTNGRIPNKERKIKTYREIVFALKALNRLDVNAEKFYNNSGNITPLNGSLIRDDVDYDFADDGKFGRAEFYDPNWRTNANSRFFNGNSFRNVTGDFSYRYNNGYANESCEPFTNSSQHNPTFLSIDQLAEVLYGLKHVSKLIPPSENITLGLPTEMNAKCEADAIIARMIYHTLPLYVLTYPDGGLVCNGPIATVYSKGLFALFISSMTELNTYCPGYNTSITMDIGVLGVAGNLAYGSGNTLWSVMETFYSEAVSDDCTGWDWFYCSPCCAFKATCKAGYNLINAHSHDMFAFLNAILPDDGDNLSNHEMYQFSRRLYFQQGYQTEYALGLTRPAIYGGGISYPASEIGNYLENGLNSNFASCFHDNYFVNGGNMGAYAEQNGLDYLMGYSLYKLARYHNGLDKNMIDIADNSDAAFPNLFNRVITNTFPSGFTGQYISNATNQGNTLNGFTSPSSTGGASTADVQAAYSMEVRCKVNPTGRVRFKAPHVVFTPGFNSLPGAVVSVDTPQRMDCDAGNIAIGNNNGTNNYVVIVKSATASSTQKVEKPLSITLYPNPTSENATIKLTNYNNLKLRIGIYDIVGKLVMKEMTEEVYNNEDEKEIQLHTESLPMGIYIVKVSYGDTYTSLKLQKQ